jgi:hypothetical protein
MANDRILENYRGHKVLSAFHKGKFRGRVWKHGDLIHEAEGADIDSMLVDLKHFIDESIVSTAEEAGAKPNGVRLEEGLRANLEALSDGQVAMLKAHFRAPDQTITATELAKAAGYARYSAANLQYG